MKISPGRSFHLQPREERRRIRAPDRRRKPPRRIKDFPITESMLIAIKILTFLVESVNTLMHEKFFKKY